LPTQEVPVDQIEGQTAHRASGLPVSLRRALLAMRVRLSRWRLDEELIAGADPTSGADLARRAEQLVGRSTRLRAALTVERVIDEFDAPRGQLSAAVPFQRDQVAEARRVLPWLAYELRNAERLDPRGVAMVDHLMRDVEGPLFSPAPPGTLRDRAQEAYDCLVCDQPL
jgi:hypothetical protein